MSDFVGARFERADFTGARFVACDLNDLEMRGVDLFRVRIRGATLSDVDISGEIGRVTVNGVEIGPLVEAELNRRHPERALMRPADAAGFREAWALLERLWAGTVDRARGLDPALLHESVGGEWSFVETLRHLVFATDAWVRRAILGDPAPWDPLDLPWDEMAETPGVPRDRAVRPSLDEVVALRADRVAGVRDFLASLTDEGLQAETVPVAGDAWPPARSFPVRECLLTVVNEEWEHRLYAERDLAVLSEP
ncbi:DinB family protein [Actinoplanes sp. CA-142083]|uniref:DinB family protein n=1 Tax=Actinoplanes sp. CA-142083 TaxID=3239903 RepID=UPI003D92AD71